MLIVILGPDGSGKTTLARSLANKIDGLSYVYFGNNPESRKYKYFERYLGKNRQGKINTLLKYLCILVNDFHYYRSARTENIIADRCPVDKILGTKLSRKKYRNLYHRVTQSFMPNPDFVILLHGDAEVLYNRTREISISMIGNYVDFYRKYLVSTSIKYVEIDTVVNNRETTLNLASIQVNKMLNR